jgi:hypothetical protein
MPTRWNSLRALAVCATMMASGAVPSSAQDDTLRIDDAGKRPHQIVVQIGGGASLSRGPEEDFPPNAEETRFGPALTGRILWRPGHLLGIGVQSGFTRVSSLETAERDRSINLSTIPALLVFSMATGGFDASVATGWQRYIVGTEGRQISSAWEMSYSVAVGYEFSTFDAFGLGAEISFTSLPERETGLVALQVRVQYTIAY